MSRTTGKSLDIPEATRSFLHKYVDFSKYVALFDSDEVDYVLRRLMPKRTRFTVSGGEVVGLLREIWQLIIQELHAYDAARLAKTCKSLYNLLESSAETAEPPADASAESEYMRVYKKVDMLPSWYFVTQDRSVEIRVENRKAFLDPIDALMHRQMSYGRVGRVNFRSGEIVITDDYPQKTADNTVICAKCWSVRGENIEITYSYCRRCSSPTTSADCRTFKLL